MQRNILFVFQVLLNIHLMSSTTLAYNITDHFKTFCRIYCKIVDILCIYQTFPEQYLLKNE